MKCLCCYFFVNISIKFSPLILSSHNLIFFENKKPLFTAAVVSELMAKINECTAFWHHCRRTVSHIFSHTIIII